MMNKKVKEIMTSEVITTTSDIDVVYAFEKLMKHKISSLPVVEDEKLIGIITATDVGHNLILDKYELGTSVEEIMIKPVVTVSPEDSIESAIKNNKVVIDSLKSSIEDENNDEDKKNVLLETIEDLEYQNETNEEIMKLLNSIAIEEFRNGK